MKDTSDSKLLTSKCNIVNDHSNSNYDVGNEIIYDTEVLKSNIDIAKIVDVGDLDLAMPI